MPQWLLVGVKKSRRDPRKDVSLETNIDSSKVEPISQELGIC
jgi:hypothetical protein